MLGFQNKKHFVKGYTRNWSGEVFVVNKIKNTVPWRYAISNLNGEPILEFFMNKNCKKLFKKNLEQQKFFKEKVVNCTSNGKDMAIRVIVGLIKRT